MGQLELGVIVNYTKDDPRVCNVRQLPDHYILSSVRLPQLIKDQTKPLVGSTVLVYSMDLYKSYIVATLREPINFVNQTGELRGSTPTTSTQLQPGEIFLESRGDPLATIPGLGATLKLGNDGVASIYSGLSSEYLMVGGRDNDEDHEVILHGDNGFFESNINETTFIQSSVTFDKDNNLRVGNSLVTPGTPVTPKIEIPIAELTITSLGKTILRNTLTPTGVDNCVLDFEPTGQITLKNTLGTLEVNTLGSFTIDGPTINLNSGTFGVARLNDTVTSNTSIDPTWWAFWNTISTQISALPTTPLDGGATLKAGLAALFGTIPKIIISKISSASSSVKAGG